MIEDACLTAILIVDNDLGFVFWLGHLLDAEGFSAYPARTVPDAALLILQFDLSPDLLVINPELPSAQELISSLHRLNGRICVIAVGNSSANLEHFPGIHKYIPKAPQFDNSAGETWIHLIHEALHPYDQSHNARTGPN